MTKNKHKRPASRVFDRPGRVIDGLINNGRLILMIGLVVSIAFMVRSLEDLTAKSDRTAHRESPSHVMQPAGSPDVAVGASDRIQHRSDNRIRLFRQCADADFEAANKEMCRQLTNEVDEAMRSHEEDELRKRQYSRDSGTRAGRESPSKSA